MLRKLSAQAVLELIRNYPQPLFGSASKSNRICASNAIDSTAACIQENLHSGTVSSHQFQSNLINPPFSLGKLGFFSERDFIYKGGYFFLLFPIIIVLVLFCLHNFVLLFVRKFSPVCYGMCVCISRSTLIS